jgi:acyl dehydratase
MDAVSAPPPMAIGALIALVGTETGVSKWITIDQQRIDAFAEITEDRQFIHIDPQAARATPFGGAIAHGFLTLSMLSALAMDAMPRPADLAMSVNYGFDKLRFISPVPAGSRIRGRFKLESVTPRSEDEFLARNIATVEIEGAAKPALIAEWLTLYILRPDRARAGDK